MNLEVTVSQLLKDVGIEAGQVVLDFGCGSGTYTVPAARIVGDKGKVYALDKDSEVLNKLMQKAQLAGLNNVVRMDTHGELETV
jgi:precorrin-6B methylase 2